MPHSKKSSLVSIVILASALLFSHAIVTRALSRTDITYPVAELGGCKSEAECRAFCDQSASLVNIRACVAFAQKHNLLPQSEIDRAEKFIGIGGKGPGGCSNENDCVAYCENGAHVDECLAFADKTGILPPDELAQAKKFSGLIKSGESPGGCKSKTECVAYCTDGNHSEECVTFLTKAGFLTQKEADLVRQFKGKSPGDCAKGASSFIEAQKSCNAFCNDPTNQPVCFRFLEEAGIMTAEEATQAGSLSDFQACVPSAPPEIQQCFIDNLGQDLFNAMKQGVMPFEADPRDLMAKVRAARACVNRFADQSLTHITNNPDALACISSQLGSDYLQKAKLGEVKCGDAAASQKKVESCIEKALSTKLDQCFSLTCSAATTCLKNVGNPDGGTQNGTISPDLKAKIDSKLNTCMTEQINGCLAKDCSEATACLQSLQGSSGGEQQGSNQLDPALQDKMTAKMTECAKQQQSQQQPSSGQQQTQQPPAGSQQSQPDCSAFASVPSCSYITDPQGNSFCKQCFPGK